MLVRGSRGPDVIRAQQLLNRFLRRLSTGSIRDCVGHDSPRRSTSLAQEHRQLLTALHQRGQLPLKLDGIFGRSTEQTVRLFQNCRGLVPDGKIGPVTRDYLERQPGTRSPRRRPEPRTCGVPERPAAELEQELDLESEMLNEARRRRRSAVRPRLSFFLNASSSTARNHFQCQASRVARRLGALAVGREDPCTTQRVGPTSYDTGADIVGAISSAHTCLNHKIGVIHIFGHSGSGAIYGPNFSLTEGLYTTVSTADRASGAREISDIPASALTNDVVVLLHGCNQGADTDSFAEQLYRHLRATLTAPVVLAHYNSGCAGRDNSWIRFDNRTPTGRRVRSVAPHYSGNGCCSPAPRRRRAASHEAVG